MGFLSCKIPTSQTLSSVTKSLSSKRFRWGFVHFSLSDCAEIGTRAKETEEGGGEGREFPLSSLPSRFPPFLFAQRKMHKTPTETFAMQVMWQITPRTEIPDYFFSF